uniref:Anthranilate synthase component 2 n=1 Tax=Riquetophycus sp. TaxID=1897556 RepID=A0A1C9C883_9FLOR|nr:anthranilate synthase component 2 [Riquetophycus sp.]
MILIIDNYDSFTQNLVQCVGQLDFDIIVARNDSININHISAIQPSHIILSPGPGNPSNTNNVLNIISSYANRIPILGVCLGHQSIGYVYGAQIIQLKTPMHGKISKIWHNDMDIFTGLPNPFWATRYHSLVINSKELPKDIEITAWTQDGTIMGCRHKKYSSLRGIQFHPESLWTEQGQMIIKNFLIN